MGEKTQLNFSGNCYTIVESVPSTQAAMRSHDLGKFRAYFPVQFLGASSIIRYCWHNHQLVDSGLKLIELSIISDAFLQVWEQTIQSDGMTM